VFYSKGVHKMKRLIGIIVITLMIPFVVMSQKDWRRMERRKVVQQVRDLKKKNGLNEIAADPKGFKLYAVVRANEIIDWQAKGARGKKLKVTKYEYAADADNSKEPGKYKMIVVCVEEHDVCYEVQMVPIS
jgi:hypothetical protein